MQTNFASTEVSENKEETKEGQASGAVTSQDYTDENSIAYFKSSKYINLNSS